MATPNNSSQNVTFRDVPNQWNCDISTNNDPSFTSHHDDQLSLSDFFSRPIKIYSLDWEVGAAVGVRFDPWTLFFSNTRVLNRISNYNLLNCKLCLKFIINGTIFHYSRILASYIPLFPSDKTCKLRLDTSADLVEQSQRPHIFLDPTYSQGGNMTLPFFWYKNWLNIPNTEWTQMGSIQMTSFDTLKHANGATSSVNISVFAWAEEVKVAVPTTINPTGLVIQSSDEYGVGIISKPATSIAKMMGLLNNVPAIGPYARATQIAAQATSAIASSFGYCRPNVISAPAHVRPILFGNHANVDAPDTAFKLSVDSKQELNIDSRTVGLSGADEMTISSIATRPTYLTSFGWNYGTVSETHLFSIRVSPVYVRVANTTEMHVPACTFAAVPFRYWHGSMKYRFQVVASAFHKGRLKIVYDPGTMSNTQSEYNIAYTRIVDIGEEKDFELTVGWGHENQYLNVSTLSTALNYYYSSSIMSVERQYFNGTLSVFIVNELVVPNTTVTNDISVNVFVSTGDDISFAAPDDTTMRKITYMPKPPLTIQTGDTTMCDNCPDEAPNAQSFLSNYEDNTIGTTYFGETITSFRALLKRYQLNYVYPLTDTSTSDTTLAVTTTNFPLTFGWTTTGIHSLSGYDLNVVYNTLITYLTPAFVAVRGGIRTKYKWANVLATSSETVTVSNTIDEYVYEYGELAAFPTFSTTNRGSTSAWYLGRNRSGFNGAQVVLSGNTAANEVEFPYYNKYRFSGGKNPGMQVDEISTGRHCHRVETHNLGSSTHDILKRYVSVGEDFSLFFFTGAPIMYVDLTVSSG